MALFEPLFQALERDGVRYVVVPIAGRPQDLSDIAALEAIRRERGESHG